MFSCQICEIFQNTYLEEHLRTTASKHRSSFLEVFCRSCCSALINAVMKYNFSAAVVQSWRVLNGNLLKIALHHRYFSKNFAAVAEQPEVATRGVPQTWNFIKKETLTQVFSCEYCEISKNTFFTEHLWATASKQRYWKMYLDGCFWGRIYFGNIPA